MKIVKSLWGNSLKTFYIIYISPARIIEGGGALPAPPSPLKNQCYVTISDYLKKKKLTKSGDPGCFVSNNINFEMNYAE